MSENIYRLASSNKAKVIIGLDTNLPSAERLVNSALFAKRGGYAEPVFVSGCKVEKISNEDVIGSELPLIVDDKPEETLADLLKEGAVDAGVRGNLGSRKLIPLLRARFQVRNLCRVTILEVAGGLVMLAPVGIEEGDTKKDLLLTARNSLMLSQKLGILFRVAVISGGRLDDKGRSAKVDRMLESSESLVQDLLKLGMVAENYGIELERAIGDGATLILAPDGVMGNLIFRSLVLVANIESYGACAASLPRTYIDTSRAKGGYLLPIIMASALSKRAG